MASAYADYIRTITGLAWPRVRALVAADRFLWGALAATAAPMLLVVPGFVLMLADPGTTVGRVTTVALTVLALHIAWPWMVARLLVRGAERWLYRSAGVGTSAWLAGNFAVSSVTAVPLWAIWLSPLVVPVGAFQADWHWWRLFGVFAICQIAQFTSTMVVSSNRTRSTRATPFALGPRLLLAHVVLLAAILVLDGARSRIGLYVAVAASWTLANLVFIRWLRLWERWTTDYRQLLDAACGVQQARRLLARPLVAVAVPAYVAFAVLALLAADELVVRVAAAAQPVVAATLALLRGNRLADIYALSTCTACCIGAAYAA